jgi:hypothetical protein
MLAKLDMRKLVAAGFVSLCLAAPAALAQNPGTGRGTGTYITPLGFCQFTAQSSAQLLSAVTPTSTTTCTPPAKAAWATVVVETNSIRFRDDGTAPTVSVGMLIAPTSSVPQPFTYNSNMKAIQFIAVLGSPVVDISFYDGPGLP